MAKENQEQSFREYGKRKKRIKRIRNTIIGMLLLALALGGTVYVIRLYNKDYRSYKVVKTMDVTGETAIGYLNYGSSLVKYSRDGAVAYDKDGGLQWNGSYEMSDPIADTCGKYVVVADRGGTLIHIFDENGAVSNITTLYKIVKVEIASQGVVAALMEEGDINYYFLYDTDGTVLVDKGNSINNEGYPMDIALSDDGKKLIINCLDVSEGKLASNLGCYNFDEVGQNWVNNMVGGFPFNNGHIVPEVAFLNNNTFCAYKDNGFVLYEMNQMPKKIHEETLEGRILSVFYNEKYTGVVLEPKEGTSKRIMLYNLKGDKILDKPLNFDYKKIMLVDEEIIMFDNLSCLIMKTSGKVKFRYPFEGYVAGVYPINNLDRYFLVNGNQISQIQLKE